MTKQEIQWQITLLAEERAAALPRFRADYDNGLKILSSGLAALDEHEKERKRIEGAIFDAYTAWLQS